MGFEEMEAKLEKEDGCGRKIEVDFFGGGRVAARASHCGGFSCGAWALECAGP